MTTKCVTVKSLMSACLSLSIYLPSSQFFSLSLVQKSYLYFSIYSHSLPRFFFISPLLLLLPFLFPNLALRSFQLLVTSSPPPYPISLVPVLLSRLQETTDLLGEDWSTSFMGDLDQDDDLGDDREANDSDLRSHLTQYTSQSYIYCLMYLDYVPEDYDLNIEIFL